jgi:Protein of unknown function (DUF3987)
MPALALILHVIDGVDAGVGGAVSGVTAERAAAWCQYLEAHARRLYATVTDRVRLAAALLASRMVATRRTGGPSPANISRPAAHTAARSSLHTRRRRTLATRQTLARRAR